MRNNAGVSPRSLARVTRYILKNYKAACLAVVLGIIVCALATLAGTLFMQSLIDDYIAPMLLQASPDYAPLGRALVTLAAVLLVGVLCSWMYNRVMVTVSQGTMKRLRVELFSHMESLPVRYFDTHAHGDIMSVYTNDVDTLRQFMSQSLPQLVNSVITLVSTFISMLVLDIPLTLLSLAAVVVMVLVSSRISKVSARYFTSRQADLGAVNGYIEEMIDGQKVVKSFCREEKSLEGFRALNERLRESADSANRMANITMPVNANLGNISYVLCAVAGGVLALGGWGLSVGTLVAFLSLNKSFTQPVTQISQQMSSVVMAGAGAARMFSLLDEESEPDNGYVELVDANEEPGGAVTESAGRTGHWAWRHPHKADGTVTYQPLRGGVVFDGVDFGYTDGKLVLHDIRMYAEPGQKIAIVGSTGAGKTTITNLINRFYDIQDGKIRYDGININKIKKPDLRRSLGIVPQDTHLFTGTVMENIRYGRQDATDEECMAAAGLANADSFIRRLPDGYDTLLTHDGSQLSQGQRQLIAIARAAVADPPVLILDEATSSIDTRTEALVQRGMDALMKGRTSFVIAHRLSTVRNADCIMVLEHGRRIERGTHDSLMEQKGRYYQLYTGSAVG